MAQKNKLLMFGTILIVATIGHSKMLEIKNENTIMFIEENEKEVNDDLFVEFVDGKIAETPDKNIDLVSQTNIKTKKNKVDKNKYIAFEQDGYGILAANLEELDEDYIASSQVFQLTGINDSLEPFNRRMYAFNTQLDRKVLYPASRVYAAVVPKPIRKGISNFYNNFSEIPTFVNSLLQLKPGKAVNALGRFVVNSTVGILGVADVAKNMGMKRDPETMGDTLGHYGVGTGSYLVLPMFGPSNIRDAIGTGIDTVTEGAVRGVAEEKLFFDTGVFDKTVYGFTRPVVTGLNARSMLSMRYGDLNSPFEYDLVRALYHNYRKIQVVK
ncbi:MlaA family lipoprotein [Leptotrichia massiliensis]|uniref:MlaA family lipoprotein n=1 Tax=Leptotrichia massiliensis TaxID=1852388 RepID=UPI0008DACD7D|nr:VacJ family lipoprotein [Leptotrichia massiliensis]